MIDADPLLANSRVLIVDDDVDVTLILSLRLKKVGIGHIAVVHNGEEGLAAAASFLPDLVILDVNMPVMGGHEMCRRLRATPDTADLPVLFQTGNSSNSQVVACFEAGASDYIAKPYRQSELVARVRVHLQNRHMLRQNRQMLDDLRSYASRVEQELSIARRMQEDLSPSREQVAEIGKRLGFDIAVHAEPSSEIGGDLWSVFERRTAVSDSFSPTSAVTASPPPSTPFAATL